ncbi:iron ABC transporter ATP-binding protein [Mycolicibacterium aurum]|uniref:Iron ABC transporter ATP-binding protein n=1 Tax=Mycolicibacterium aurum TaxID=1791 RepID=A0A3S5EIZ1_MYCAU|nr:ABC transporter ATP-binding protein [Mycolicibacterium aurum]VEG51794.1 iron ABC transporter ATP-binding protein [Mycolicibacterium aurum]
MTLRALDVTWSRSGAVVLDRVTVEPTRGSVLGLLGPNGSGKSSLLRLLAGLDRPNSGRVELHGRPITDLARKVVAREVAMVGQHADTELDIHVGDIVRLGRLPHRRVLGADPDADAAVHDALAATGLTDMVDRLWHSLSGGERQRVQIARALAQQPGELLLDEPTNHLDIAHQLEILSLIGTLDLTAIVALHDLNLAAMFCDEIVVLSGGRVVAAGTPATVLTEELIAEVYGVRCRVGSDGDGTFIRYERPAMPAIPAIPAETAFQQRKFE